MTEKFVAIEDAETGLLECAAFVGERIRSADGHADAMQAIVPLYLEKNEVDLAAGFADSVADPFVRDRLLTLVAEKCAEIDDDDYAFQLTEAMEDFGTQEAARERLALQKAKKGDFARALEIAAGLQHPANALADVAIQQNARGDEPAAMETLDQIDFPSAEVHARHVIAHQFLEQGAREKALEMLDDAAEAAGEIEFNEEKLRALLETAALFLEAARSDKAVEIYDRAKRAAETIEGAHRDAFLVQISLGFLKAGSLELADRTLDQVADKAQTATCLSGFAQNFWTRSEKAEALEALEEAYAILKSQTEKEIRDSRARFALFGTLAVQFAQFEKAERGIEIAQQIEEENSQMNALASIAQVCVLQDQDDLARQALQAILIDANRMFALIGMSDARNKNGDKTGALELLEEAAHLAETVPQYTARSTAYNEITRRFLELGENEKARRAARENLDVIALVRDESNRAVALAGVAGLYQKAGFKSDETERQLLMPMIRQAGL